MDARFIASAQLQAAKDKFLEFQTLILTSAQEVSNKTVVADIVIQLLQIYADFDELDIKIRDTINPAIDAMNSRILDGATKLTCFSNKVPKIDEKNDELVTAKLKNFQQSIELSPRTVTEQVDLSKAPEKSFACEELGDIQTGIHAYIYMPVTRSRLRIFISLSFFKFYIILEDKKTPENSIRYLVINGINP